MAADSLTVIITPIAASSTVQAAQCTDLLLCDVRAKHRHSTVGAAAHGLVNGPSTDRVSAHPMSAWDENQVAALSRSCLVCRLCPRTTRSQLSFEACEFASWSSRCFV